jgi:SAM-dependent methyltransferase
VEIVTLSAAVLEHTWVYRLWQAPFAEQKFAPIQVHNDLGKVRRVLDVACGPGTNTAHFAHTDYLGIDYNERYIRDARRRYQRQFVIADVRDFTTAPEKRFDFILVNSFLHHLKTEEVKGILLHLRSLLAPDGQIHALELVMQAQFSVARVLAGWDRGKFARSLEDWRSIFGDVFEATLFEPYVLTGLGITLWNMVYFRGRAKG